MITITDKDRAIGLAPKFDFIISILDPSETRWNYNFGPNHILVRFYDTEQSSDLAAQKRGMYKIFTWVKEKGITAEHKVLIHCHAGISRSSATAWIISIMQGEEPLTAFQNLYKERPCIWPNGSIMAIGDEYLGLDGSLIQLASQVAYELQHREYLGYGG